MTIGEVLLPVAARQVGWLTMDDREVTLDREEDPDQVRAIQMVLRMERSGHPNRRDALELAATGCALLCLDERSAPGGEWHDEVAAYGHGHIRKVVRRARAKAWEAVADLPGLTLERGETQVRVFVPGLVSQVDPRIGKLQVSGTDIPAEEGEDAAGTTDGHGTVAEARERAGAPVLRCLLPPDVEMTAGKLMAQCGHAGMLAAAFAATDATDLLTAWHDAGCPSHVEVADRAVWADVTDAMHDPSAAWRDRRLVAVRDAGFTEIDPGTLTVVAELA